jgi:chromosome segregation ATPase
MNNIQNINQNIASTFATQAGQAQESQTSAAKKLTQLLGGQSVTVTMAPTSDLEKLVAQLKNENDSVKASVAQRRLASVLDAYTSRYGELTEQQTQILEAIAANNADLATLKEELKALLNDKTAADAQALLMQAKIEQLEKAIEQAVKDGKAHRENIEKLKEQIAEDQDNEDLKAELAKEEAALATSEAALAKAQTDLASAQAAAGALSAKIEALAGSIETKQSAISALEDSNAALAAKLDPQTITNLLAAFSAQDVSVEVERNVSAAEEEKAEQKAIANDPANVLRDAMDKMDEAILQTIDENRDKTV